jgi:hypothetical protein
MIAVLIHNKFGKANLTQKLSPLETIYPLVNPANTMMIENIANQTMFVLAFLRAFS